MRPENVTPTAVLKATVVVSILAVAAIAFVPSGGDAADNRSLFGDHATDQITTLDGVNATVVTVIEHGNETSRSVERVSLRPATGELRSVLHNSSKKHWDLRVSNGSVLWLYDTDSNEVDRVELTMSADSSSTQTGRLTRLFERLARSRTTGTAPTTPTPGIRPLPAVPHAGTGQPSNTSGAATSKSYDVRYLRNGTVDGRSTYVVEIRSRSTSESAMVQNYTQRLWLDTEYFYPLQRQTSWQRDGDRTVITTTYRDVTFDPGLDDSLFTFDPPANATKDEDDGPDQWTYSSIADLQTAATTSVPTPDVPPSFELVVATRTRGRVHSIGLRYISAIGQLDISKSNLTWYQPRSDAQPVSIGDRRGEFRNLGPEQTISWTCDEWRYSVTGNGLAKSLLIDIAESVSCE